MAISMDKEARALRAILAERKLTHLHVTKRGKALTIASGPPADPDPEARLTLLAHGTWRLDLRHHAGRWDQTPFTGSLADLVDTAEGMGRLEDIGPPGSWNRGDTSDPSH
jgi:hypothetical protein